MQAGANESPTGPRPPARRRRLGWAAAGAAAVLLATAGLATATGWLPGAGSCQAAVPEPDPDAEPVPAAVAPARLGERWPPEWAEIATGLPEPFGEPRFAVPDIKIHTAPQLVAGGTLLLREGTGGEVVRALDSATGQTRWQRHPHGGSRQPVVPVGSVVALVADPYGEELTVVTVDPVDGEVRACVQLDKSASGRAAVAAAGADLLAVARPTARPALALVDPRDGTVAAESSLEVLPRDLRGAGEVVVASVVPADHPDDWRQLAVNHPDRAPAADLLLRAYSAADATPAWEYAFEPGSGGIPFAHQLVAAGDDLILLVASRFDPPDGWHHGAQTGEVDSHLVALDPATGQQRWSRQLPPHDIWGPPEAGRFGDTVLVRDPPRQPLVGYDAATGEERWRLDTSVDGLRYGAYLPGEGAALLPTVTGVIAVDLADGGTRTVLDGMSAYQAVVNDDTIGIELGIADSMLVLYDRE